MSGRLISRLTAPLVAVSVLLLGLGGGAAWYVQRVQENTSNLLAQNVTSVRAAEELEIAVREVRSKLDRYLINGDRKHLKEVPQYRAEIEGWLKEAQRSAATSREQELVARMRRGSAHLFAEVERLAQHPVPMGMFWQINDLIDGVLTNEILRPAHAYLKFNEELLTRTSAENQRLTNRLTWGFVLLGVCGAGAGLLAGAALARGVRRSIVQIDVLLRDTAGQLSGAVGPIRVAPSGGLPDLEATARRLTGSIRDVLGQLEQSRQEARRAEQLALVGQMAAGLAHEVRNPLTAMKVLVQTAAERGGQFELHDLPVLEEEIDRLEGLTRTFLEFARPPRPERRPADVRALLERAAGLLATRADVQGVHLTWAAPAGPVVLEADAGQLQQVLLNLLLNALEATPPGGTIALVAEEATDDGTPALRMSVTDTGPGLPPELGPRIFEPFVSTKETGLGLGLSVCRRVVEAHGGTVTAADRPGGGAVFTLTLPLSLAADRPENLPCPAC